MKKFIIFFMCALVGTATVISCSNNSDNEPTSITITYDSGFEKKYKETVAVESSVTIKSVAELGWEKLKEGYLIDYWEDSNQNKNYEIGKTVQFSTDVILQAHWTNKTFTIHFDANGGEIRTSSQTSTTNIFFLDTANTLGLYRIGYSFKGWSKSESAETVDFTDGAWGEIYADITLYAVWEENPKYTVTFSANGGTIETQTQTIVSGVSTALKTSESLMLTREGFIFKGWAKKKTATAVDLKDGANITISEDTMLYAVWAYTASYTITYNVGEGSITTNSQTETGETISGELSTTLKTANELGLSRTGYVFKGWASSSTATTVDYVDGKEIKLSSDLTLYAIWDKIVTYTVIYDVNDGYSSSSPFTETATGTEGDGATITLKTATKLGFSKSGYLFVGWSESSNGYASFDGGKEVIIRRNTTFYAIWELPRYTITYVLDNASYGALRAPTEEQTYTEGETISLPTASSLGYTKKGYRFLGWSNGSGWGSSSRVDYSAGTTIKVTKNMSLRAVWEELYIYVCLYHPGYSSSSEKFGTMSFTVGGVGQSFSLNLQSKTYTSSSVKLSGISDSQAWATSFIYQKTGYKSTTKSQSGYMTFVNGGSYKINVLTGNVTKIN